MKKFFTLLFSIALYCANISAQQLNEDFEGQDFPPEGWITESTSTYSYWKKAIKDGTNCAYTPGSYGTECWLITLQLKPANGEKLKFKARIGDYGSKGELRIEVSLNGTETESFELIDTYYTSQSKGDEAHRIWKSDWREFTVDLSAYENQLIYIAFHQVGEVDGIFLDDVNGVRLAGNPLCESPTDLTVSGISAESATISWQGEAAVFQYIYVKKGENADWNYATITATNYVTLTNLDQDTYYEFYVRAWCSNNEISSFSKVAFKTPCASFDIPWEQNFNLHETGAVEPECWTVSSAKPQVWMVAEKVYDAEGKDSTIYDQAHLYVAGGGPNTEQVFALPTFDAQLNTLEIAFDYKTSTVNDYCGKLEIGYMTNPLQASTFVSLKTLPQTLIYLRVICTLEDLPANAQFIAFRFAGGTSDLAGVSMDNFVVAEIGKSCEFSFIPYKVIGSVNFEEMGSVRVPSDFCSSYIEIEAIPNYGYHFEQWSDGIADNPRTIKLTQDTTFTAEFACNPIITYLCDSQKGIISGPTTTDAGVLSDFISFEAIPNYGYAFAQWSDGITDNPRTIELTQDTTFTAEFVVARTGTCGDDNLLTWSYDPDSKQLIISGNGTLNTNYTFGLEAPSAMKTLEISNGITSIGESAFINGKRLETITLGGDIEEIGEYAFANCPYIFTINSYMEYPPIIEASVFANDGDLSMIDLYVPEESIPRYKKLNVWKEFNLQILETPTAVEHTTVGEKATKILRNGQILILRGEKVYTITGQEAK